MPPRKTFTDIPRVHLRDAEPVTGPEPVVRPSSTEMPDPSERLARLQLLGEVARGGMGVIIKGRDSGPRPRPGRQGPAQRAASRESRPDPPVQSRRPRSSRAVLQHPGVVPVYELGTLADHRPYFAMKLIKGRTLAALLAERAGPAEDQPRLLGIFEQVCLTMAYAHVRGVIHRDVNPSNIMVGSFGEVQVMDLGAGQSVAAWRGRRRRGRRGASVTRR